jgi:hypothetical protein
VSRVRSLRIWSGERCTAAIIDTRGKRLGHHVIETNGQALVEFFKTQAGTLHVCIGE